MRLHRLDLTAFGPYPGSIDVDFDRLSADGLFLLHGETGAGKTTLLDAVAFALFGRVPGVRNEAKRLRSDLADPHTRTQVTLEASVGPVRFVITRNPEYLRPKSNGRGQTPERHRVLLRWIGTGPAGSSATDLTRADEVGEAIRDLLGMSADQFFQVVLLPQGDFARFLRADTADREDLLEQLFDTGRFGDIETWFAQLRRDSHARLAILQEEVDTHAARVAEAAGLVEHPTGADGTWLSALSADLTAAQHRAADAASSAEHERVTAAAALRAAIDLHDRRRRWLSARAGLAELDRCAAALDADRRRLADAERAMPVAPVVAEAQSLAREADRAGGRARRAAATAAEWDAGRPAAEPGLPVVLSTRQPDPAELRRLSAADRQTAGALQALRELAAEQDADQRLAAEYAVARPALERARDAAVTELEELPDTLARAQRRSTAAQAAAARLDQAGRLTVAARTRADAAARLTSVRGAADVADHRAAAAVDAHQRAVDRRQELAERRIAGMAGELGAMLTTGVGCPVCGATEHPRPAPPSGSPVSADDLALASDQERTAAGRRSRAERARAAAVAEVAAAEAAAGGLDPVTAHAELAAAEATEAADRRVAVDAEPAAAALARLLARRDDLTAERERTESALATVDRDLAMIGDGIAGRAQRLARAGAGHRSIADRRTFLLGRADLLETWAVAVDAGILARRAADRGVARAEAAAIRAGFADAATATAAIAADVDELRAEIRRVEDRRTALEGQLAAPDLVGIEDVEPVDVAAASASDAAATAAAQAAKSAADAASARTGQVAAAAHRLRSAWSVRDPAAAEDAELAALADVIAGRGQNHRAMSLRAYVLAAKLHEVAVAGSARLERMSGGRYTFVHSAAKESRGRSGGLGLDVLDGWSGQTRPTRTLSGGETFLAALALALGLSDVVAAESGGRVLDTLFIDEGFGTLDADALELVMTTLDELRSGGRIVGLVSHVDDLRQRIPSRLRVRTGPGGSEVDMSVA